MRIEIFTGSLIVILVALIVTGEMALMENRSFMRSYNNFTDAVDVALDDACECLALTVSQKTIDPRGADHVEGVFIESLASALGKEVSLVGKELKEMTNVFVISNGLGLMLLHRTNRGGGWKYIEGVKSNDDAAEMIMENIDAKMFLPDKTDLTQMKAADHMSVLVSMTCIGRRGLTGNKRFVCIRNAQLRVKSTGYV